MKIETKFDVGQEVYFLELGKVVKHTVEELYYYHREDKDKTEYIFRSLDNGFKRIRYETEIFATKEELINSL